MFGSLIKSFYLYIVKPIKEVNIMKKLLVLICLLPSILLGAQTVDYKNFDTEKMNNAVLKAMVGYTKSNSDINENKILSYIKRNNEKFELNDLDMRLNTKFLAEYDTIYEDIENVVTAVGVLSCVSCDELQNYEEISAKCVKDYNTGIENLFSITQYGKNITPISYYNKKTNKVYIFCVFK